MKFVLFVALFACAFAYDPLDGVPINDLFAWDGNRTNLEGEFFIPNARVKVEIEFTPMTAFRFRNEYIESVDVFVKDEIVFPSVRVNETTEYSAILSIGQRTIIDIVVANSSHVLDSTVVTPQLGVFYTLTALRSANESAHNASVTTQSNITAEFACYFNNVKGDGGSLMHINSTTRLAEIQCVVPVLLNASVGDHITLTKLGYSVGDFNTTVPRSGYIPEWPLNAYWISAVVADQKEFSSGNRIQVTGAYVTNSTYACKFHRDSDGANASTEFVRPSAESRLLTCDIPSGVSGKESTVSLIEVFQSNNTVPFAGTENPSFQARGPKSKALKTWEIVLIVIGGVVFVVLIIAIAVYFFKQRAGKSGYQEIGNKN